MITVLKQKILNYAHQQRYSIMSLERKAGLKSNAIHHILNGKSKNPSLYTLSKIADVMGCSLDEIVGRKVLTSVTPNPSFMDSHLFHQIYDYVTKFITTNALEDLLVNEATHCIEEIYKYCFSIKNFDENFAQWFLAKTLTKP